MLRRKSEIASQEIRIRQPRKAWKYIGAGAIAGASVLAAGSQLMEGGGVTSRAEIKTSKPKVLWIKQNIRVCPVDVGVGLGIRGKESVVVSTPKVFGAQLSNTTKMLDEHVQARGDFAVCAEGKDITMRGEINADPTKNKLDVMIAKVSADRPRITNLGAPDSVQGGPTGVNRLYTIFKHSAQEAQFAGILQNISTKVMDTQLCAPEVMPHVEQGFQDYFNNVGTAFNVPDTNVHITYATVPEYQDGRSAEEHAKAILGSSTVKALAKNDVELSIDAVSCEPVPSALAFDKEQLIVTEAGL